MPSPWPPSPTKAAELAKSREQEMTQTQPDPPLPTFPLRPPLPLPHGPRRFVPLRQDPGDTLAGVSNESPDPSRFRTHLHGGECPPPRGR